MGIIMAEQNKTATERVVLGLGALMVLWATVALIGETSQAGSISELVRQYMVATSMITPLQTLVDCATHIKGIDYLLWVAFIVAIPTFYSRVNTDRTRAAANKITA